MKPFRRLLWCLMLGAACAPGLTAQTSQLGKVEFPTSGSAAAQTHFLRGLAALHSFWYEEALEAFREATRVDPDFMMGYWGEAMAHNHSLWEEQDTEAARKVLGKVRETPRLTARERAYLGAVRALYGEGDKLARDLAYAAVMEKVARDDPDDQEAAAFYALALLGTVRPADKGFRRQVQAGAIALEIYRKNPGHPGAAHYIIHAFDDPEHAILALPAARRYAEIAPEAHHARHMPSHIFLQLGMWPEAVASNESAWAASEAWVKRRNLPLNLRDYHSYHWLTYVYLQQGRYREARTLVDRLRQTMRESGRESVRHYDVTAAAFVVETQRWDQAAALFEPEAKAASADAGEHAGHSAPQAVTRSSYRGQSVAPFVRSLAAAAGGAEGEFAALRAARPVGEAYGAKVAEIRELEVAATAAAAKAAYEEALKLVQRAAALEEEMAPPSGPPTLVKPAHELYGEILLRAGKPKEAAGQFKVALLRQPNRARSLLGTARAAAQAGDRAAASAAYSDLLRVWQRADPELPELKEARDYVGQASAR